MRLANDSQRWPHELMEWLHATGRFLTLVTTRFIEDQGLANAASLTYTTLLSLVPLMTVSLAIFAAFPISDRVALEVQNFVFANFLPNSGAVLQRYFQEFSNKAAHLTGPGFVSLIVVALLLMENIDRAFNRIWRSPHQRRPVAKFLEYWAVLTLGPILIGLSMAVTSYLISIPIFSDAAATLDGVNRWLKITPLLASIVAFTLLYAIVPNRWVSLPHALAGAVLAAVLFEGVKQAFANYLTIFSTYEAIYGALAMVPIFLVWVYSSWAVTLLGAEFACCLGLYRDLAHSHPGKVHNEMLLAYQLLRYLREGQQEGRPRSMRKITQALEHYSEEHLEQMLLTLSRAQMVVRTERGHWALTRDLSEVRISDLYCIKPWPFPLPEQIEAFLPEHDGLRDMLTRINAHLQQEMDISLESLIGRAPATGLLGRDACDEPSPVSPQTGEAILGDDPDPPEQR